MKKTKKLSYFVAVLLLFSSIAAIGIGKDAGEVTVYKINEKNLLEFPNAERVSKGDLKVKSLTQTVGLGDNIPISEHSSDDVQPAITKDASGNIVVAFTEDFSILDKRMSWS